MTAYAVAVIRETRCGDEIKEYLPRIDGTLAALASSLIAGELIARLDISIQERGTLESKLPRVSSSIYGALSAGLTARSLDRSGSLPERRT